MAHSLLFAIALLLSTNALAQSTNGQRLVVVAPSSGRSPESSNKEIDFFPSEIVTVLASKGDLVLVHSDDDGRPAWLARANLADASSFRPVATWNGEKKFEVSSASGDSGQVYYFKSDGSFRAEFDNNQQPRKWSGQLYQFGQIFWAKSKRGSNEFEYWSMFRRAPNGKLCMLNFDTPPGCECVGTYGGGATSSCK